jgi:D-alanyl-D-alanine carboxypeptidase
MIKMLSLLMAAFMLLPASTIISNDPPDVEIVAPYYIVVDADDPSIVFYERDPDAQWIPASTMKIMTCILAIENIKDYSELVEVTKQAANLKETNSLMEMYAGEMLSVDQLLHGLMLVSGNDAALMLATHVAGSVEAFSELANAKAAELGMVNSHFLNASGAYRSGQFSSARDMALLTAYALKNEKFREIISTVTYTIEPNDVRKKTEVLKNSNRLISDDPETGEAYSEICIGGKTGSTINGGKCLVAAAELDGARVIVVLIGADDLNSYDVNRRMPKVFANAKFLLEYTLETDYAPVTPDSLGFVYATKVMPGAGAAPFPVSARFDESAVRRLPNKMALDLAADIAQMEVTTELNEALAEAKAGDVVGTISCSYQGRALFSGELVADTDAVATPLPVVALPMSTPQPSPESNAGYSFGNAKIGVYIFGGLSLLLALSLIALIVLLVRRRR